MEVMEVREEKVWYRSKRTWFNIGAIVLSVLDQISSLGLGGEWIAPVIAGGNLILNQATRGDRITLRDKGN